MMTITPLSSSQFNAMALPRKKAIPVTAENKQQTTDVAMNAKATEKPSPKQSKYPVTTDTF